ncbi:hypothetical protein OC842_001415 [Tilletia horrida]|uniref:Karyogamy protein 5 n=1 Tax=Tilletia horrida TaxID=155126 RepID=A0AAN6GGG6_9BASI|nr:hypothetical protein OC842_001415 [Tilletia horrida]
MRALFTLTLMLTSLCVGQGTLCTVEAGGRRTPDSAFELDDALAASRLGLSEHKYGQLFSKALAQHPLDDGCYHDVLTSFEEAEEHSAWTEDAAKRRGAIAFFLCDAAADSIAVPQECKVPTPGALRSFRWKEAEVRSCIHALHRVPQLWASFDNHRKVFPLLLFVQRQRRGVDEARSLYSEARSKREEAERAALLALNRLRDEGQALQQTLAGSLFSHAESLLDGLAQSANTCLAQLEVNISQLSTRSIFKVQGRLEGVAVEAIQALDSASSALLQQQAQAGLRQTEDISTTIERTLGPEGFLASLLRSWQTRQGASVEQALSDHKRLQSLADSLADAVSLLRSTVEEAHRTYQDERERAHDDEAANREVWRQTRRSFVLRTAASLLRDHSSMEWSGMGRLRAHLVKTLRHGRVPQRRP